MDDATRALAWLRHDVPGAPALCLVCSLERAQVSVTLCTARSGLVSVLVTETAPTARDARLADPRAWRPIVLRRAAESDRYLDAVVYEDESGPVRAGELIDVFSAYRAVVHGAVGRVVEQRPEAASAGYMVTGEVAGFPLTAGLLADVLPFGQLLNSDRSVDVLQRGGDLLTAESVRFPPTYPYAVALRIREIRRGRLANGRFVVAPVNTLRADGQAVFAESSILTLDEQVSAIGIDVVLAADDVRSFDDRPLLRPRSGRYAVGLRLVDGIAELVLRPDDGGAAVHHSLDPLPVLVGAYGAHGQLTVPGSECSARIGAT
jgi:hypothetical protein